LAFEGAVSLKLSPSVSAGLVHFVIPLPIEFDGVAVTGSSNGARDTAEGELTATLAVEQNVGWLDHVGKVGRVIRHP